MYPSTPGARSPSVSLFGMRARSSVDETSTRFGSVIVTMRLPGKRCPRYLRCGAKSSSPSFSVRPKAHRPAYRTISSGLYQYWNVKNMSVPIKSHNSSLGCCSCRIRSVSAV